ncbi:hypothetical protein AVEN_59958-1 [Araneus ventricosus]|uniref:Uncharacterized protein n=1 Tax=Araneus ventricosus TaxID=182803 RepID=A0A4Y2WW15_ARAVE|nr:hypothetical protein AVEN_59958-1 [Araneus ventricosus]
MGRRSVVYIKYFSSQFIIKEDRVVRDDGSELVVARKIWKLTNDAYPSIFPNQPSYLSLTRKSPSEGITAIKLRDEQNFVEWCTLILLKIFQETYAKKLGDGWLNLRTDDFILCYRLDIKQCPSIVVSMKIYKDLTVEIWHDSVLLKTKSYHFILGEHNKCDRWTKFDSLSWLATFKPNEKVENAIHLIKDAYSQQDDFDKTLFLTVIIEQLKLTLSSKHIYSTEFLLPAAKFLGKAENANQQANTVQAFKITSLFSKYKEIVALVPMKNQTADDLHCQTLKVLQLLNDCQYNVL